MASTAGLVASTVQTPSAESNHPAFQSNRGGPRNRNRNRNRNQDGNRAGNQNQGHKISETPQSRGNSGRSSGRGDFGLHEMSLQDPNSRRKADSSPDLPPGPEGGGTFGDHLTKGALTIEGEVLAKDNRSEGDKDEEADVCFICASPVVHSSVAPCNHRTCHICALRLRALYKTTACAHCRVSFTPGLV